MITRKVRCREFETQIRRTFNKKFCHEEFNWIWKAWMNVSRETWSNPNMRFQWIQVVKCRLVHCKIYFLFDPFSEYFPFFNKTLTIKDVSPYKHKLHKTAANVFFLQNSQHFTYQLSSQRCHASTITHGNYVQHSIRFPGYELLGRRIISLFSRRIHLSTRQTRAFLSSTSLIHIIGILELSPWLRELRECTSVKSTPNLKSTFPFTSKWFVSKRFGENPFTL